MRGIENAGHDGNSGVLSWLSLRFLSPPHPTFALYFFYSAPSPAHSSAKGERERERGETGEECVWYIACVPGVLRCRFLMDYLFRALLSAARNWSGKRAFIVSPTNEIRFRAELPASILKHSINLDIDGFNGSFYAGIFCVKKKDCTRVYRWKIPYEKECRLMIPPTFIRSRRSKNFHCRE